MAAGRSGGNPDLSAMRKAGVGMGPIEKAAMDRQAKQAALNRQHHNFAPAKPPPDDGPDPSLAENHRRAQADLARQAHTPSGQRNAYGPAVGGQSSED